MPIIEITKIATSDFKRIQSLKLDLSPITVLVGGNVSLFEWLPTPDYLKNDRWFAIQ